MKYFVVISSISIFPCKWGYNIEADTFIDLKTGILKRFGNLRSTNKADKEKLHVKQRIWESKSIQELMKKVNDSQRWRIEIEEKIR